MELPDENPEILRHFLQFVYTGNYDDGEHPIDNQPNFVDTLSTERIRYLLSEPLIFGFQTHNMEGTTSDYGPTNSDNGKYAGWESEPDGCLEQDDSPSTDVPLQTVRPNSLFTSLRLYVMAKKFGVPALVCLSRQRFYMTARETLSTFDRLPLLLDELYSTPTDISMRELPCQLIAPIVVSDASLTRRLDWVIRKHGDFALGLVICARAHQRASG